MTALPRSRRVIALALLWLGGCGGATAITGGAVALHDLHEPAGPVIIPTDDNDFYRLPFPNDLRRRADGNVDLSRHPRDVGAVQQYMEAFAAGLPGFGTNSGIYFRFSQAIDPQSLPRDAAGSLAAAATAWVVDVTPASPTYGKRSPVSAHYVAAAYDFIGPHWIVLLPYPGVPLRENTTYAALLTDGIRDAGGLPVRRAPDFDAVMSAGAAGSGDARIAAAARAYAPLTAWLASQPGLAAHLLNATVFTTRDATGLVRRLRKAVYDHAAVPALDGLKLDMEQDNHYAYVASYAGLNFQQGDPPYALSGGAIVEDNGVPRVQRMESMRLALSIPKGVMPAAGWPVVLYAPGTGADFQTLERDGSASQVAHVTDLSLATIARMAMVSIDPVLAGPRAPAGADPDFTFFNWRNPVGARFNPIQGATDHFQLLRLVKAIDVAAAPGSGQPIKFDPDRIYFKGHSEGSLTGSLFLSAEPEVKAAVLSGAGSNIILTVLNKHVPVDIARLVAVVFRDKVDIRHPVLNLLQDYLEESDPSNYVRYFFKEPPPGMAPKSIYQSLGLNDHYSPPAQNKAQALATGLQPVLPQLDPIDGLDLVGQSWTSAPVASNVAGGRATGVLVEYPDAGCRDGHLVAFCDPRAMFQLNAFLASHAATGVATLSP